MNRTRYSRSIECSTARLAGWSKARGLVSGVMLAFVLATCAAVASAEPAGEDGAASRLEKLPDRVRERVERFRNATPAEREARRERLLGELRDATPRERRRLLRRERRLMRVLPEEERSKIREENQAFREKHDLPRPGAAREFARDLELSAEERRVLRAKFRELPREERRALWRDITRYRSLSPAERETLEARLDDLKSLSDEERTALRENAQRWSQIPEETRERLREQLRKLRALPPDERAELLERALAGAGEAGDEPSAADAEAASESSD
ncbi:MAG: DUF3106 domain-containing protein [Myxococcota bacterium]|nr:DUF3106 domain-containing protein [Myxococcota bacterium]